MKVCHTKAMKMVKELESRKDFLIKQEGQNCLVSYREGEKKILNDYNYAKTRSEVQEIDTKIRKIKVALAVSNANAFIDDFKISITEGLILLAQLENQKEELEMLSMNRQRSRRLTANGVIEFTECLYDIEQVKKDIEEIHTKIGNLQIAIDRANLNTFIEV